MGQCFGIIAVTFLVNTSNGGNVFLNLWSWLEGKRNVNEISSAEELQRTLDASEQKPLFIFKHSTACPISAGARDKVNTFISRSNGGDMPTFYVVKVIESRPVSNQIEADLGVRHQSPQLILVKGRKAVWSASHYGIDNERIAEAIAEHAKQAV
jgi:bacillithiol system protein YtxJ